MTRYQVKVDGADGYRPRFSREFAVVDTKRTDRNGLPLPVLETNDLARAGDFATELNSEA